MGKQISTGVYSEMKKILGIFGIMAFVIGFLYLAVPYPPSHAQTVVNGRRDGFNCVVTVSTATTLTAVGGACASPGTRPMFVTDIEFGSTVISSTGADSFPTLKFGTGTTCGTGTTVFWQAQSLANTQVTSNLNTPIKIPKGNDICWIHSVAGSKTIQIHGFYGADQE